MLRFGLVSNTTSIFPRNRFLSPVGANSTHRFFSDKPINPSYLNGHYIKYPVNTPATSNNPPLSTSKLDSKQLPSSVTPASKQTQTNEPESSQHLSSKPKNSKALPSKLDKAKRSQLIKERQHQNERKRSDALIDKCINLDLEMQTKCLQRGHAYHELYSELNTTSVFKRSEESYKMSLAFSKDLDSKPEIIEGYCFLGFLYLSGGKKKKAIEYHKQAKSMFKKLKAKINPESSMVARMCIAKLGKIISKR